MFMQVIPTFVVTINSHGHGDSVFRVPDTDLMTFIRVLRFNGYTDFSVSIEGDNSTNVTALPTQEVA
jgi:hypothetical protein